MNSRNKYIENLRSKGYTENFTSTASSNILTEHKKLYKPAQIKIASFFTCTSDTDPAYYSVTYAIETADGKKGILVDDHCESPDTKVEKFINCVKLARQNQKKSWFTHPWQKMFAIKFSMNV